MFKLDTINVPIIGLVENMSWFTPKELPDNRYYLFGRDGAQNLAKGLNIPFLGCIPIVQSIRESVIPENQVFTKRNICRRIF